jgi:hypothetical protein
MEQGHDLRGCARKPVESSTAHTPARGIAAAEELRADVVRLTERLTGVVAANADLFREQCRMTARVEVSHQKRSRVHCS